MLLSRFVLSDQRRSAQSGEPLRSSGWNLISQFGKQGIGTLRRACQNEIAASIERRLRSGI
jgi:hypothetical protein